jgi:hypothetical protein
MDHNLRVRDTSILEAKYGFKARKIHDCSNTSYNNDPILDYWYGKGGAIIILSDGTIKDVKKSWDGLDGFILLNTMIKNGDII